VLLASVVSRWGKKKNVGCVYISFEVNLWYCGNIHMEIYGKVSQIDQCEQMLNIGYAILPNFTRTFDPQASA